MLSFGTRIMWIAVCTAIISHFLAFFEYAPFIMASGLLLSYLAFIFSALVLHENITYSFRSLLLAITSPLIELARISGFKFSTFEQILVSGTVQKNVFMSWGLQGECFFVLVIPLVVLSIIIYARRNIRTRYMYRKT